jgi:hypothetical protein
MAKKSQAAAEKERFGRELTEEERSVLEASAEPQAEEQPAKRQPDWQTPDVQTYGGCEDDPLFECVLNCPTPLAVRHARIHAKTETEARAAYERINGISGSGHEFTARECQPAT